MALPFAGKCSFSTARQRALPWQGLEGDSWRADFVQPNDSKCFAPAVKLDLSLSTFAVTSDKYIYLTDKINPHCPLRGRAAQQLDFRLSPWNRGLVFCILFLLHGLVEETGLKDYHIMFVFN